MKKRKRKLNRRVKIFLILLIVIAAGTAWFLLRPDPYKPGKEYLSAQETKDQAPIETAISKKKLERLAQGLQDGTASVYSLYNNAVILGDSRVVGFENIGAIPPNQVMADAGDTILNISNHIEEVKAMQPEYIYLSYGVNDMGLEIGADRGENGYRQVYEEQINALKEAVPKAKIVVNSIIHVTQAAKDYAPNWANADSYNAQIEQMCKDNGWIYVNNNTIDEGGNGNFYQPDGVHFSAPFYEVWAQNMAAAVLGGQKK